MYCSLQGLPAVENHAGGKLGCHPGLAMRRAGLLGWGGHTATGVFNQDGLHQSN